MQNKIEFLKSELSLKRKIYIALIMAVLAFVATVVAAITVRADTPLWSFKGAKWYSMMETGNVMVGLPSGVTMLDGENGKTLWQRSDLGEIKETEYTELSGTPLVLISDNSGFAQRKTKLTALDVLTGETVWQTDKMLGFTVQVSPIYERDMIVFLTIRDNRINKDKPDIFALKMSTGELLWQNEYTEKVDLYGVEKKKRGGAGAMFLGSGGGASDRFDLSGENPPIFDGDSMYMTYAGLHRYSLSDGKLVWKTLYDVTDGSLKNTNGQAIVDGDTIFTSAQGIIRAVDKSSGALKWTTKDFGKGGIGEMLLYGDTIYGRMGGQFFSAKKGEWQKKTPIGVVALNKASGSTNWIYEGAKNSITNMVVLSQQNVLMIGDEKNLIGLDLGSQGKVKEAYKVPLKFKFKVGAAATAGKVAAVALGGVGGFFKKGADTTDEPISLVRQENGTVVARGRQHLLAFDPASRQITWSTKYEAPGIDGWQSIVMTALTVTAAALSQAVEAQHSYNGNYNSAYRENNRFLGLMTNYQQFMSKKYSSSKQSGNIYYVLTSLKTKDDKGSGLVGVNLLSGRGISQIIFKDKSPDYEVDETAGRLFNMNKGELSAYSINEQTEQGASSDDDDDKKGDKDK
ncbi:MAG TPA: PQQ-binding-like beta-propeller repeat protein [Pyrinomonadaceae bacterium]|jgi:outer membrane protein assembly factor BamB|nr:PQQ-binding-like beta-propeller repeat protein [Pyrinomonadaceae bacterium]